MNESGTDREQALDRIRGTYRNYRAGDRHQLWDRSNRGYARMAVDRDRKLVDLMRPLVAGGASVLDIGCGTGELAEIVRAELGDVRWTGVDLLPEAIQEARRSRPWARWIEASADQLPLPDRSFDVIIAATLFSSLPTRAMEEAAATEIARVLSKDGAVVWYDLRYPSPGNPSVHPMTLAQIHALFAGFDVQLRSTTLLPPVSRRLGVMTPILYPVLEWFPALRSHFVGTLRAAIDRSGRRETS